MDEPGYDLEMQRAIDEIKKADAKLVCIQLPDGLKPKAKLIKDTLEEFTQAKILIWLGSCYGACDYAYPAKNFNVDLLIQWGHNPWIKPF